MHVDFRLEDILPHGPAMILLSGVEEFDVSQQTLSAFVIIEESAVFFDKDICGVPAHLGLEYMAQAIGCLSGICDKIKNDNVSVGFMLGTRKYNISIDKFLAEKKYIIAVQRLFFDEEMASFFCKILDDDGNSCAEANLNVYRPKDSSHFESNYSEVDNL